MTTPIFNALFLDVSRFNAIFNAIFFIFGPRMPSRICQLIGFRLRSFVHINLFFGLGFHLEKGKQATLLH
jgi:hypothetical protein